MDLAAALNQLVEVADLALGGHVEHELVDHEQLVLLVFGQHPLVAAGRLGRRQLR